MYVRGGVHVRVCACVHVRMCVCVWGPGGGRAAEDVVREVGCLYVCAWGCTCACVCMCACEHVCLCVGTWRG